MTIGNFDIQDVERRMKAAIAALKHEFAGLRTGRASASLLDSVMVNTSYGGKMPINQLASVSVPEARLITVQVWDRSNISAVDKAIREADLDINPIADGQVLRLRMPELNEDSRRKIVKIAHTYTEKSRVAIRNVRKDALDVIKKMEKDGEIGKDDSRTLQTKIQDITDRMIKDADAALQLKEQEVMQI